MLRQLYELSNIRANHFEAIPIPEPGPGEVLLRFFIVYNLSPEDRERALVHLGSLLATGRLQHNIAERLPLEDAATAHELVESGRAVGNVVLEIS